MDAPRPPPSFFGSKRLDEIGPADVEVYKAKKLDEGQNRKSINNHLTALRKLLNLAAEWGRLDRAPKVRGFALKTQPVGEDESLTFDEADRLLRASAPEWMAMLAVALTTGVGSGNSWRFAGRTWTSWRVSSWFVARCGTARKARRRAAGTDLSRSQVGPSRR